MALRKIIKEGDMLLRKKCKAVKEFDDGLATLLDDMRQTMESADGVGLAAPQVGVLRRAVVIDVGGQKMELINPEIISQKGEQTAEEGCLSVVGFSAPVTRPQEIVVKAFNRYGEPFTLQCEALMARCICHECDHLDGILFIDKCEGRENYKRRAK